MKKKTIITITLSFLAIIFMSSRQKHELTYIGFDVSIVDPTIEQGNPQKSPIDPPSVSLDDHTLYFGTPCDGCTLNVVDSNDVVVYTTVIPVGMTSLVLPSTLSGEYELQIIQGNYCFYGPITL